MASLVPATLVVLLAAGADQPSPNPAPMFRQYCFQCHGKTAAMGGVNLEQLTSQPSIGDGFRHWEKVATALEQKRMPPEKMPQPADAIRAQAAIWIRAELSAFAKKHDGDPGRVTVRRLTSGEYAYTIRDLTGLELDAGIDAASDSVGGEGFTNFGDVQFMQDANVQRYLEAAKFIANHAVIGSGPLEFFADPGKTGFELSAITRIKDIYAAAGFRTVSGEGGRPFGLEKYGKAFYAAWRYRHRAALGEPHADWKNLAAREGVSQRFAEHIWSLLNRPSLGYPASEVAARWRKLPAPGADAKTSAAAVRAQCEEMQNFLVTWPSWLFARGDVAAGGAGDESPLEFNDAALKAEARHHFTFNAGGRGGRSRTPAAGSMKLYLNIAQVNPNAAAKPVVIWRDATIAFRRPAPARTQPQTGPASPAQPSGQTPAPGAKPPVTPPAAAGRIPAQAGSKQPLRDVVNQATAARLDFGKGPGGVALGPGDFAADASVVLEIPMPEGVVGVEFQADAQLGGGRDQVLRVTISDREDGGATRGKPAWTLLADPQSDAYRQFKAGVMELAAILPPNSHAEPTPADKDPVPEPFDNTYNVPEHDEFVIKVKYLRGDRFVYDHMMDDATRARLNHAWNDVYASFEYHDNYLRLLGQHYKVDMKGKHIGELELAQIDALPPDMQKHVRPLRAQYLEVQAAQAAARSGHIEDCLRFAARAWRRPLTENEKQNLRAFYEQTLAAESDHRKAIRALLSRILVAPAFLYRVEQSAGASPVKTLSGWEVASRLSYFLWSSIPDDELRRAAAAGELSDSQQVQRQARRMLADPKARRLSTEFFGQWLGFYHFDQHRGVDTSRFPEFTDEVKSAMYDEAVSFFEHIIRKDRPVREILSADYTFLNQALAKHYGAAKPVKSTEQVEWVDGASGFHRGGLLRLGAVLTTTSAPLRTSPVKRGDWVLRRVLGTAVPPPPADAGSIPADDKLFGGLSLKEKLEAHKRNATCANCHARIDPLGFPLERYDSVGRWREQYPDGKPINDTSALADHTEVAGVDGLVKYLQAQEQQVVRTLSNKLLGYALGRTVQASDHLLIDRMAGAGGGAGFSRLVEEIVTSRQFRTRVGREENAPLAAAINIEKAGGR